MRISYCYKGLSHECLNLVYDGFHWLAIINRDGEYVGTLTEGDLLWAIKNHDGLNLKETESMMVSEIPRHSHNTPVCVTTDIDDLVAKSLDQNFVPVIDGRNKFIGIITRKNIIKYFYDKVNALSLTKV